VTDPVLERQYEGYPYPPRDPADEAKRLVTGSPSHLHELNHFVFGGRLDLSRPLRALVAGGGTGDATVMLAQMTADAGCPAEIVHLDLSERSIEVARARLAARGLSGVEFRRGSLLDLDPARDGRFRYIDCCGVLHHLEDPPAGLRALAAVMEPDGGMGIMVYAPYGRTGVYPLQDALRRLAGPELPDPERVEIAKRLVRTLPATNWFRRNPQLGDHALGDAGIYDLLLHGRDRPYDVPALLGLVASAGLVVSALVEPARYDPANVIGDPKVAKRLQGLDAPERWALAERLAGNMAKHTAYLVRPERLGAAVAGFEGPEDVPVLRNAEFEAMAKAVKPGQTPTAGFDGLKVPIPLPRLGPAILARVDGRRSFGEIRAAIDRDLAWERFEPHARLLVEALSAVGGLFLRKPPR
jgi:SAM-dependent methyltransferase